MTQITYIKSSLKHSSALTTPEVALTQFSLWSSIKKAFKKWAKPLAMIAGIALSIAVPFIAAPVAGFIFQGTALAAGAGTFGATIGAAIAGAGMGAVAGALTAYGTEQDVLMGAALGGLGGAVGGGIGGYTSGTLGAAGGAAGTASTAGAVEGAALGGGQYAVPASASIGGAAPATVAGQVGMPTGMVAASTTGAGMSATTKALLEATLKAAPSAIGTLVSSIVPSDVGAATAELQAEMQRLQNSDIEAYNKAKMAYDQLYARYQQIDPVAAAQLAEANVQMKTAGAISQVSAPRGAASAGYATEAEKRRLAVAGSQEASGAYTDTYYRSEGEKTQMLAGLKYPTYSSSSGDYLTSRLNSAEQQQAALASDVSGFLTPYALALAPKDTTLTSEDQKELDAYRTLADKNQFKFA